MAQYDTAELLARCILQAQVPSSVTFPTAANWYTWMTDAQVAIKSDLAVEMPAAMMNAPTLMSSADSGATYTFGTDAGSNPIYPIGRVDIYRSLSDVPDNPMTPGVDYLMEGYRIRAPRNGTMSAPYGRWVTPAYKIDASTEPTLPLHARPLIVYLACAYYASSGGQQDPSPYLALYNFHREQVVTTFKKQFGNQGSAAGLRRAVVLPYVRR